MKYFIFISLLLISCSDSDPVLLSIDGEEYKKSFIESEIKRANRTISESEVNNYIQNVLIASHLFYKEAMTDSLIMSTFEKNDESLKKKVLFERIMEDSVILKSTSEAEVDKIKELNKNKYSVQVFLFKTENLVQPSKDNIEKFETTQFTSQILTHYPNAKSYEKDNIIFSEERYQAIKETIYLDKPYHVIISNGNITGVIKRLIKTPSDSTVNISSNKSMAIHKNFLKNKFLNSLFYKNKITFNESFIHGILKNKQLIPEGHIAEFNDIKITTLDSLDQKRIMNPKLKTPKGFAARIIYPKLMDLHLEKTSEVYSKTDNLFNEKYKKNKRTFFVSAYNSTYIQNEYPFTAKNSEKDFDEYFNSLSEATKQKYRGRKLSLMMNFLRKKNNEFHLKKRDSILVDLKDKYKDLYKVH